MCNPQMMANMQGAMSTMQQSGMNAGNPNAIPSMIPPGVGATSAAPNGMPGVGGGAPGLMSMARGVPSPMIGAASSIPPQQMGMPPQMPPAIPGADSVPPSAPGAPTPPPGAISRLMAGGPHPNGRGKMLPR